MDCKTARLLAELRGNPLVELRPAELPAEDAGLLDQHLRGCPECGRALLVERRFDAPIAKAMRVVPVPAALKARILDRLASQRGAVYRRRFFYAAAAAASVFITVGLLTWQPENKAKLDLNELVLNADGSLDNPKAKIDGWLSAQGIRYQPPLALNPSLVAFHGTTTIQGKQVPTLTYRGFDPRSSAPIHAQVYIIREGDFDLSNLPASFSGSSTQGYHLEVLRDPDQPTKLAYVILFQGDSLEPFLIKFSST